MAAPNSPRVLVSMLKSNGPYSFEVARNFPERHDVLTLDNNRFCDRIDAPVLVHGYRSPTSFAILTVLYLPFYLVWFAVTRLRRYDALYIPMYGPWDLPFAWLFKAARKPVVSTIHDAKLHAGAPRAAATLLLQSLLLRCTDHVVFLSKPQQRIGLRRHPEFKERTSVVPHGLISVPGILVKPPEGRRRLLFIGTIARHKGVEMLVEACLSISDQIERLDIVGRAEYDVTLPTHPKIHFRNTYVTDEELAGYVNRCDILVLPYLEATQSGVLTIGIDAQKPMVCTDVPALREQLDYTGAIFVPPTREGLANGIHELASNVDLQVQLHHQLGQRKRQLDWAILCQDLRTVVNQAITGKRS